MTNYHYLAESAYHDARPCGGAFWMELSQQDRDIYAEFTRAVENALGPQPDDPCTDCADLRYNMEKLEDENFELEQKVRDLCVEIGQLKDAG